MQTDAVVQHHFFKKLNRWREVNNAETPNECIVDVDGRTVDRIVCCEDSEVRGDLGRGSAKHAQKLPVTMLYVGEQLSQYRSEICPCKLLYQKYVI